jgi:hypothetical protein
MIPPPTPAALLQSVRLTRIVGTVPAIPNETYARAVRITVMARRGERR